MSQLSISRLVAYDTFVAVMDQGKAPDPTIESLIAASDRKVSRQDRNLIKEMVYGSLRWYSKIFWILQNTANRNLKESTPEIRAALVLGTYQIFYLERVPDRAAVNESAEYIRVKGQANAVKFVNGILRQIARRAEYFQKPDKEKQKLDYLALQFAHPRWIVERWLPIHKASRTEAMLVANNQPPPHTIRVNLSKTATNETHLLQQKMLKQERTHTEKRPLRSALRCKESPTLDPASLFSQGEYTIQDEASQLIGFLVNPQPGETIVDACSGPGGKLTHMVELLHGEKAQITAIEKDDEQLRRAKENVDRLGHTGKVEFQQCDFLEYKPDAKVDKILLDAPCSGLGVLRRHPEGKWHKKLELVHKMSALQKKMIDHALSLLKKDGELIFSVCSYEKEETLDHVSRLEREWGDKLELISPTTRLADYYKKYVTRENFLLVYSGNQDSMDGFGAFILKLKETG